MLFIGIAILFFQSYSLANFQAPCERMKMYSIFRGGGNFIKINIKDINTLKEIKLIIDNSDFSHYLAISKGGLKTDKYGRFINIQEYVFYRKNQYVKYMISNHNKIIEINFRELEEYLGRRRFGSEKLGKEYVDKFIINKEINIEDLNVSNENELIEKFFDHYKEKGIGLLKQNYFEYSKNPSFIALLIDMGYIVGIIDSTTQLYIDKNYEYGQIIEEPCQTLNVE